MFEQCGRLCIFDNMEPILVYPENAEQLKAVKEFLETSHIHFEAQKNDLPLHVLESIDRGLKQAANGETISFEEFKARHFSKK